MTSYYKSYIQITFIKKIFNCKIIFLITLFILTITQGLYSQENSDIQNFRNIFSVKEHHHNWSHYLKESDNEFKIFFSFLFIVYKELFSSQDMDSCVFTPSCSVYAIESIEKKGIFLGTLSAFDRISRCNPGRKKNTPIDKHTGKYYDPVLSN